MNLPKNKFKHAIASGAVQLGMWSVTRSPIVAEAVGGSGFDWILLDTEHAPNDVPSLIAQMQALATSDASILVRPAWNDPVLIKRILDSGAQTILVPYVQNAEEARAAVAATRYPPEGIRGAAGSVRASDYGRNKTYLTDAASEIAVLVQVETAEALQNIEAIAAVSGIDGVFIGPSDLSASMGYLNHPGHEDVQRAIKTAVDKLKAVGKPAGILAYSPDAAKRYIDLGYQFLAIGSDLSILLNGAQALLGLFDENR